MRTAWAGKPRPVASPPPPLSSRGSLGLAAWFGLAAGYLDLGGLVLAKQGIHSSVYYQQGRFFPWAVPLAHLTIMMAPGLLVAGLNRLRPGLVPVRAAAWLFSTLAIWGPLLNLPLSGTASLLLAAGSGRVISGDVADSACAAGAGGGAAWRGSPGCSSRSPRSRSASMRWRSFAPWLACPRRRSGAANVLLIVMDTVRAESLSLYGYTRDTTPQLVAWARRGVRFDWALAPSCLDVPLALHPLHRPMAQPARFSPSPRPRPIGAHPGRVPRRAGIPDRGVRGEHQLLQLRDRAGPRIRPL